MKKTLLLLTAIIALCAFTSCKKEPVNEHPLEGVWGFMSYEVIYKDADGKILNQEKTEYDPFNPSKPGEMKIEFTWVSGNDYTAKTIWWNPMEKKWETEVKETTVSIRDGNRFFSTGINGELEEMANITISGDTFILDGIRVKQSLDSLFDEDAEPGGTEYIKETYKRME